MKYPEIYQNYAAQFSLPESEWLKLESLVNLKEYKKGDFMTRPGEDFTQISIVIKGLFRLYYIGDEGREYIKAFRAEGEMTAPYAEILQKVKVRTFVEALEDSKVIMMEYSELENLAKGHECWNQIRLATAQQLYIQKEQKEFDLLQLSAAERYQSFLGSHGHLINRIPQYHIASYLGITPVALSRIVKKLGE